MSANKDGQREKSKSIGANVPEILYELIVKHTYNHGYNSIGEFLRHAVRALVTSYEEKESGKILSVFLRNGKITPKDVEDALMELGGIDPFK